MARFGKTVLACLATTFNFFMPDSQQESVSELSIHVARLATLS
jgi:hypothetical protein